TAAASTRRRPSARALMPADGVRGHRSSAGRAAREQRTGPRMGCGKGRGMPFLVENAFQFHTPHRSLSRPARNPCRGAAILSSLKRPAILSPFSAMKEDGTDGGVAVEAVGGGSAVGRGEAHAAGGGARAPALGATGAPRSTGRGARGPGGAAARQRRAGAGEQAPRGGAEPAPS